MRAVSRSLYTAQKFLREYRAESAAPFRIHCQTESPGENAVPHLTYLLDELPPIRSYRSDIDAILPLSSYSWKGIASITPQLQLGDSCGVFLKVRLLVPEIIEEDGLEVAFGSAAKDGDDHFPLVLFFAGFLERSPGHSAAADAY